MYACHRNVLPVRHRASQALSSLTRALSCSLTGLHAGSASPTQEACRAGQRSLNFSPMTAYEISVPERRRKKAHVPTSRSLRSRPYFPIQLYHPQNWYLDPFLILMPIFQLFQNSKGRALICWTSNPTWCSEDWCRRSEAPSQLGSNPDRLPLYDPQGTEPGLVV